MFTFRLALLIIFAASSFVSIAPLHAMAESVRDSETLVYAALINHAAKDISPNKSLIIQSTTVLIPNMLGQDIASEIKTLIPEASSVAIADLVSVGNNPISFNIPRRLVRQEIDFAMQDEKVLRSFFNDSYSLERSWKLFYSTFPTATGIIRISRVGIDAKNKQAILYVEFSCGGLCGSGNLVLLQQKWWRWEVVRTKNMWVS